MIVGKYILVKSKTCIKILEGCKIVHSEVCNTQIKNETLRDIDMVKRSMHYICDKLIEGGHN
jgi:hypothetical protein